MIGHPPEIHVSYYQDPETNIEMVSIPTGEVLYRGFRVDQQLDTMDSSPYVFFAGRTTATAYARIKLMAYEVVEPIQLMVFSPSNFKQLMDIYADNKKLTSIIRKTTNLDSTDVACTPLLAKEYDELLYCPKGSNGEYWAMELAKELNRVGIQGWYVQPDTVGNVFIKPYSSHVEYSYLAEEVLLSSWQNYLEPKGEIPVKMNTVKKVFRRKSRGGARKIIRRKKRASKKVKKVRI